MSSNPEKKAAQKAKQHTVYKTSKGRVPGTTTITGVMAKQQLIPWANDLGLKGINVKDYVDELADIGTLAHAGIHAHLTGQQWETDSFSKDQIDAASTSIIKWHYWADQHKIEVVGSEMILVSEEHQYGGTCDLYCTLDGIPTLVDIKTGKGIYDEMGTQLAGYRRLLIENGHDVKQCFIVRIGRNDDEGTQPEVRDFTSTIELHDQRFLLCRQLYALNNQIRKPE